MLGPLEGCRELRADIWSRAWTSTLDLKADIRDRCIFMSVPSTMPITSFLNLSCTMKIALQVFAAISSELLHKSCFVQLVLHLPSLRSWWNKTSVQRGPYHWAESGLEIKKLLIREDFLTHLSTLTCANLRETQTQKVHLLDMDFRVNTSRQYHEDFLHPWLLAYNLYYVSNF